MKKKHFLFYILVVTLLLPLNVMSAENAKRYDWKLKKDKDGVKTFSRFMKHSSGKEFRAVAVIDYPIEVLLEVIIDVASYPKWMPDVLEATILKEFHKGLERGNYYVHIVYDGIWPVKNRDIVMESIPKTDWDKGISVIKLKKLDTFPVPLKKGIVRVKDFASEFKFEYLARDKTKVTFTTYVDVGGKVSPRLATIQTGSVPHKTLRNMARVAADPKYYEAAVRDYF